MTDSLEPINPIDPKISRLYHAADKPMPSKSTDVLITQLAHEAIAHQKFVKLPKPLSVVWGIAASLLLALSLGWQVLHDVTELEQEALDSMSSGTPSLREPDVQIMNDAPRPVLQKSLLEKRSFSAPMMLERETQRQKLEIHKGIESKKRKEQSAAIDFPCGQSAVRLDSDPAEWKKAIEKLQDLGDKVQANCLIKAYEQRFGNYFEN